MNFFVHLGFCSAKHACLMRLAILAQLELISSWMLQVKLTELIASSVLLEVTNLCVYIMHKS